MLRPPFTKHYQPAYVIMRHVKSQNSCIFSQLENTPAKVRLIQRQATLTNHSHGPRPQANVASLLSPFTNQNLLIFTRPSAAVWMDVCGDSNSIKFL